MTTVQSTYSPAPALADLVAKYDGRAPRYTSYPTAVQFTPSIDAAEYRAWLRDLPTADPVSVYIHIPFCSRLCWYCGCNTRAVRRHGPVADYVGYLMDELALLEAALPGRLDAGAIHLGGGTPNMLTVDELDVLFTGLGRVFRFQPGLEVAAEIDPPGLTREWVQAAAGHGLNRASLGVQNLSPRVQEAVNRQGSVEEVARCMGWLREAGVASINLDLMYGLPHQTVANTLSTLDEVLPLRPERLALFGYAHVPWMKSHQQLIHEAALPGPAERLDQSEAAAERLVAEGYVRIGLDHFALPSDELARAQVEGRLHRNFQGYTADAAGTLLGLGASAIGSLPQGFVQNVTPELGWRELVAKGELPVARGVAVTREDRFRGEIIERLMCDLQADLFDICERHNRELGELSRELARLRPFEHDGLVICDGGRVRVTETGRLVVRTICAVFDRYFAAAEGRHSRAL
ncbi:MAG: oxygen-independent coproporphyrinogen III oxidase [Pseudomonadota bacterium]